MSVIQCGDREAIEYGLDMGEDKVSPKIYGKFMLPP